MISYERVQQIYRGLLWSGIMFCGGVAFTIVMFATTPHAKYTETPTGWKLEHIPMPVCPDDHKRTVDVPERDEVDALTITCEVAK